MYKITIDAGHGGNDRFNVGPTGYVEADGTLQISRYLKSELLATGAFDIKMTRIADKTLSLTERGKMGAGSDLFLSVHTNACDTKRRGTEVYYSVDLPDDKALAQKLCTAVASSLVITDGGAKTRESQKYPGEDYYTVVDTAQDGGAKHVLLIECAYHDNAQDEKILKSDANLLKIARAIAQTICSFFGVKYTPIKPKFYKYTTTSLISLPIIKLGSKGESVKLAQQELTSACFPCGVIDGSFGQKTDEAVKHFQEACHLTPDGRIGVNTWAQLLTVNVVELYPSELKASLVSAAGKKISVTYSDFVNSNFFCGKTTIGWLISDGKILSRRDEYKTWKGNPKGTLIIYKDGKVEVGLKLDSDIAPIADSIQFCCQGFNLFPVDLKSEGWSSDVARCTKNLSIGYNSKSGKIIIAVRTFTNGARAEKTMSELGCSGKAIRLDSGESCTLCVNGNMLVQSDRELTNIIYW